MYAELTLYGPLEIIFKAIYRRVNLGLEYHTGIDMMHLHRLGFTSVY